MKKIQLNVPDPCHENWFTMTPAEKGRYCNSCQKVVIDFSVMTDAEIIQYFQKDMGNTCGNFTVGQLGRDIREPATPARKRYWGMLLSVLVTFFAACKSRVDNVTGKSIESITQPAQEDLTVAGLMLVMPEADIPAEVLNIPEHGSKAIIKGDVELEVPVTIEPGMIEQVSDSIPVQDVVISGKVRSVEGEPIPGASIHLKELSKMISTNAEGNYSVSIKPTAELTMIVSSVGYEVFECKVTSTGNRREDIILKPQENELAGVVVVGYAATRGRVIRCGLNVIQKQGIGEKVIDTVRQLFASPVSVFPNPAMRGSTVNIRIENPSAYLLQLVDNSGKMLLVKEVTTRTSKEVVQVDLPASLNAGMYIVSFWDKHQQRNRSVKLFVR